MKPTTKNGLKYLILGCFATLGAYAVFDGFQQLESGQARQDY